MDVHVVGDGPVRESLVAALGDVDVSVVDGTTSELTDARFGVVTDVAGSETFDEANQAARTGGTPWIAIEVGGVGGRPIESIDAAISGFASGRGCFECLRSRVISTTDEEADRPTADRSAVRLAGAIAGHECVRLFSGGDSSIVGEVVELPYVRRRLLPIPGCSCADGERDRSLEFRDRSVSSETPSNTDHSVEATVARAETAIDDRVGLVTGIGEAESFPAPYYLATVADTEAYSDASAPENAAGVAVDWNEALMKAVGEALERYCAGVYREREFVRAAAVDLDDALSPTDFVRPDDAPGFDPTEEHLWVEGERLDTGERTYLPAAVVQFPQPETGLLPAITTGLGLGSSLADALYSGLTEVLERDATMLSWYSTFEPIGLAVDDESFATLEKRVRSEGLDVTALLVTQDVDLPVVTVAVHRNSDDLDTNSGEGADGWPQFAVGSSAALDPNAAAAGALAEAVQNWMELRGMGPEKAADERGSIGEYASFPEAAREFVDVDETIPAERVRSDTIPTGPTAVEALVSSTIDAGLTPYAARITTRDVETLGFEAVRVVVPEAQPLFTRDPFFGERAETVPTDLGFEPRLDCSFHPYP